MNSHTEESNLLWLLKEFKDLNRPLVLWDMVSAMLAFKQSMPEFVELVLTKWLSVSYLGFHADIPMEDLAPKIYERFSAVPSRLLHILNVISRRVMLSDLKTEEINRKLQGQRTDSDEEIDLWLKMLEESERELRERLVGLSFSSYLISESSLGTDSPSKTKRDVIKLTSLRGAVFQPNDFRTRSRDLICIAFIPE